MRLRGRAAKGDSSTDFLHGAAFMFCSRPSRSATLFTSFFTHVRDHDATEQMFSSPVRISGVVVTLAPDTAGLFLGLF
jgi:hypothetical protein